MDTPSEPDKPALFPATRWSLVMRAHATETSMAVRAMGELLNSYWEPLYVFARRSGLGAPDAQDAVQSFYADMIRVDGLKTADESKGKLRSFLLAGFQNRLRTSHRDAHRQKRGGGALVMSLDDAETALAMQPVDGETPDKAFDRRWALTLLDHVLKRLRAEYAARGRAEVFEVLEPALVWNQAGMSYDELGEKLGMAPATVAQTVKRMRSRYRALLEQEIGDTVDSPEAMVEEREYLIRVLSGA